MKKKTNWKQHNYKLDIRYNFLNLKFWQKKFMKIWPMIFFKLSISFLFSFLNFFFDFHSIFLYFKGYFSFFEL